MFFGRDTNHCHQAHKRMMVIVAHGQPPAPSDRRVGRSAAASETRRSMRLTALGLLGPVPGRIHLGEAATLEPELELLLDRAEAALEPVGRARERHLGVDL